MRTVTRVSAGVGVGRAMARERAAPGVGTGSATYTRQRLQAPANRARDGRVPLAIWSGGRRARLLSVGLMRGSVAFPARRPHRPRRGAGRRA